MTNHPRFLFLLRTISLWLLLSAGVLGGLAWMHRDLEQYFDTQDDALANFQLMSAQSRLQVFFRGAVADMRRLDIDEPVASRERLENQAERVLLKHPAYQSLLRLNVSGEIEFAAHRKSTRSESVSSGNMVLQPLMLETSALEAGRYYLSSIRLQQSADGRSFPMMSFAVKRPNGGISILDMRADLAFDVIEPVVAKSNGKIWLVDQDGNILQGGAPGDEFAYLRGSTRRLTDRIPGLFDRMQAAAQGEWEQPSGGEAYFL